MSALLSPVAAPANAFASPSFTSSLLAPISLTIPCKLTLEKIFDLTEEIIRDLKNYELEFRIEELESKFSKNLSESTFNEIRELKKLQKIN